METIQNNGGNHLNNHTIISNIIELDITLSLKSNINQWGPCLERLEYIASVENRPNRFFKFFFNFDIENIAKTGGNHSNNYSNYLKLILINKNLIGTLLLNLKQI